MRAASLFLTAVLSALVLVPTAAEQAAAEAQQVRVHIRVGASDDDGAIAAVLATTPAAHAKSHHLRALNHCRALKSESFKDDIVSTCAVRVAGFDFYYQLKNGDILRNCLCESYNNGVMGVSLGNVVVDELNVHCTTKDSALSGAAVKKIFNHRSITCDPFGF